MVIFSKQTTHSTTNDPVFFEHGFTQRSSNTNISNDEYENDLYQRQLPRTMSLLFDPTALVAVSR